MYEQSSNFDPTMNLHEQEEEGGGLMGQNDVVNYPIISNQEVAAMEMELHHQLNLEIEHCFNNGGQQINNNDSSNSWQLEQMNAAFNLENQNQDPIFNTAQYPTTTDLLNIFPFPKYPSLLSNPSISFSTHNKNSSNNNNFLASLGLMGEINPNAGGDITSASGSVIYDPLLPLNLPPQPPLLRDLFHSLPNNYAKNSGCSLFGNVDERDNNNNNHGNVGLMYQNDNGVFEFTAAGEIDCVGKNRDGKDTKHFATERHRRLLFNDKFQALRKLIPNPSKDDRASIVGDAIKYINELKRSVAELKLLVEKKRCSRERMKRPKTENDESNSVANLDSGSSLRSSWLQRKSKNTEVDVRIVDDEVTVKLVQQKRINCLLFVSKVLDELQLDLHHVAGGLIGDYYSFLFNSKICEGSIVYASAVANKLIEVVDKQYAAIPPSSSY